VRGKKATRVTMTLTESPSPPPSPIEGEGVFSILLALGRLVHREFAANLLCLGLYRHPHGSVAHTVEDVADLALDVEHREEVAHHFRASDSRKIGARGYRENGRISKSASRLCGQGHLLPVKFGRQPAQRVCPGPLGLLHSISTSGIPCTGGRLEPEWAAVLFGPAAFGESLRGRESPQPGLVKVGVEAEDRSVVLAGPGLDEKRV